MSIKVHLYSADDLSTEMWIPYQACRQPPMWNLQAEGLLPSAESYPKVRIYEYCGNDGTVPVYREVMEK